MARHTFGVSAATGDGCNKKGSRRHHRCIGNSPCVQTCKGKKRLPGALRANVQSPSDGFVRLHAAWQMQRQTPPSRGGRGEQNENMPCKSAQTIGQIRLECRFGHAVANDVANRIGGGCRYLCFTFDGSRHRFESKERKANMSDDSSPSAWRLEIGVQTGPGAAPNLDPPGPQ